MMQVSCGEVSLPAFTCLPSLRNGRSFSPGRFKEPSCLETRDAALTLAPVETATWPVSRRLDGQEGPSSR